MWVFVSRCSALALIVLALAGCSTIAWQEARWNNTPEAYLTFLKEHPRSTQAQEAKKRLEPFSWRDAKRRNTIEAYRAFIAEYPKGRNADDARRRIGGIRRELAAAREARDWARVRQSDDPARLREFLDTYPGSSRRRAAQARLAELEVPALVHFAKLGNLNRAISLIAGADLDARSRALMAAASGALHTSLSYEWRIGKGGVAQKAFVARRSTKVPRSTYVEIIRRLIAAGADPGRYAYVDFGSVAVRNYHRNRKIKGQGDPGAAPAGLPAPDTVRLVRRGRGGLSLQKVCEIEKAADILKIIARR